MKVDPEEFCKAITTYLERRHEYYGNRPSSDNEDFSAGAAAAFEEASTVVAMLALTLKAVPEKETSHGA